MSTFENKIQIRTQKTVEIRRHIKIIDAEIRRRTHVRVKVAMDLHQGLTDGPQRVAEVSFAEKASEMEREPRQQE